MSKSFQVGSLSLRRTYFETKRSKDGIQTYKLVKRINTPPDILYNVIADVSRYHEFVPFVTSSFVNKIDEDTKLPIEAGLRVGWRQFDENFTCKIACLKNTVIAESISTPVFISLHNQWNLKEVRSRFKDELSTQVELVLRYKFRSPLYNSMSSLFHEQVSKLMIEAFEARALEVQVQAKA